MIRPIHLIFIHEHRWISIYMLYIICSTRLPGGNQVDGLPPASSFVLSCALKPCASKKCYVEIKEEHALMFYSALFENPSASGFLFQ